jgi:hypothetical protein
MSPVRAKHVRRPPIKRMFVSNTERSVVCEQKSESFFTIYFTFLGSFTYEKGIGIFLPNADAYETENLKF